MKDEKLIIENLKKIEDIGKVVCKKGIITITCAAVEHGQEFLISYDVKSEVLYINGIYNCDISEGSLYDYVYEIIHGCYEFVQSTKPTFLHRFCVKTKPAGYFAKRQKRLTKKKNIMMALTM